jgi:uncharacterized protein YggE
MPLTFTPSARALAIGGGTAAILIGAFALGITSRGTAPSATAQQSSGTPASAEFVSSVGSGRITVTGTGTVNGTPNQLTLSIGVQVSAGSVGAALQEANQAVTRVTDALKARGVAQADIQTSGLYITPNFRDNSSIPVGYGVGEYLTATLRQVSAAGGQIDAAVQAGGNSVTVDGISLNLTDTSRLLAHARAAAVADARHKAAQYASAIGQPLGAVVSITDQAQAQPYPPFGAASGAAPRASSVPISPGTQQLSVSITVVYAIG